jgi:hypothetical protein
MNRPLTTPVRAAALGVLATAVATAGLVQPTNAAVAPEHIVSVLKDDSTLSAEGFVPGEIVRVQVTRGGVVVGAVTGESDGTFEVNHDFCWDRFTPRVRAGDVVSIRSRAGLDTVRVTDVRLTEGPALVTASSFTIKGTVTPRVPRGQLVAEARTNTPIRFRPLAPGESDGVVGTIEYDDATSGAFTATFTGMNADQRAAFDNLAEPSVQHAPAVNVATIATAIGAPDPAPGPGCATTAPVVDEAVTGVAPAVIGLRNAASRLRVQGFALNGGAVTVRLRDRDGTTRILTAALDAAAGTWRASAPATSLDGLSGRVTVTQLVDGTAAGVGASLLRDLSAPRPPRASVASGTYRRTQFVSLSAGRGERIRYTLGDGGQAAPTRTRGTLYRGGQLRIARSQTLKMVAVDAAGNTSRVARRDYRIR